MRSALSATNYKLKILPPDDIIVGEKSFASRFVLESLAELKAVTFEIDKEIDDLAKVLVIIYVLVFGIIVFFILIASTGQTF